MNEPTKAAGGAVGENRLAVLAGEINFIKEQARDAIQQMAFRSAVEIGRILVEAKEQVAHGEWGAWLEENVSYSERTAQNFMSIYKGYVVNGKTQPVADLNFTQALALLGIKDAGEREAFMSEKHEVTDRSGETSMKSVEDMSKRELEKAIRELNAAKAEAEAAKKNARSLESMADAVHAKNVSTEKEMQKLKDELEAVKKERDDASELAEERRKEAHRSNLQCGVALTKQAEYAESLGIAENERDQARAEADELREKAGAYDDLQQMNHSLREQLANQPERVVTKEVEKRVEVIPDEYKKAFMENQRMRKELATYKAHEQGQTLQELAESDKDYRDLLKSDEEEEKVSERMNYFKMLPVFFPEGPIEAREVWRCFLKHHGHEDPIVKEVCRNIKRARDAMVWLCEAAPNMDGAPKLERVK